MSIFDGADGDFAAELDDLDIPDMGDIVDVAAADAPGGSLYLPDPFGDATTQLMADASADYALIAGTEGLAPGLPPPGAEAATSFIDATMSADSEQLQHMAGFEQGVAYEQEVHNDIAESAAEVRQAEETSEALAKSDLLEWQADRAVSAAASAVEESKRARGT